MNSNLAGRLLTTALFVVSPWLLQAKDDSDVLSRLARLEASVTELRAVNALQQVQLTKLTAELLAAKAKAKVLDASLAAVKGNPVLALAPYVSLHTETINLVKGPHIIFEGANVHIRDGSGATMAGLDPNNWADGQTTGLGNLIIGYNELSTSDPTARGGAHCLVLGPGHSYTSTGGFLAGDDNAVKSPFATVSGGGHNVAEGPASSIAGGALNHTTNTAWHQSISGGGYNTTAGGWASSISGGLSNTVYGHNGSITGGYGNTVVDGSNHATISGGSGNIAAGDGSTVGGGTGNSTIGMNSSVGGGFNNTASADSASVSGGSGNNAAGVYASVSGGANRTASTDNCWVAGELIQPY